MGLARLFAIQGLKIRCIACRSVAEFGIPELS